ncbi:hypothetical protein WJ97_10895 [Burkholderia ubonensis]|uniref:hypothetical protein n=1 Tax=Burkholderia ubonensis TaxID=101571 RepID=UPI00075A7101|nr:hypothetical protein [Burkholderia ubonensis]KVP96389.1 hypothetical protein WJ97_10895 [Burkholderia ubonensis]
MKNFLTPLLLAAGVALAGAAQAETLTLEPIVKPLDPALERVAQDSPSAFEVRSLSLPDAKALLASSEGATWQVLQVQGPVCENTKTKNKAAQKNCQVLKAECKKAEAFAREHAKHAACSTLYTQTTVLLTNDAPPNKSVKAAKAAQKKVSKSSHKPKHKAAPVSGKPAASSCDK